MKTNLPAVLLLIAASAAYGFSQDLPQPRPANAPVLWSQPDDLRSRNLSYGAGGAEDQPHLPLKFIQEDMQGTNPKFTAEDGRGNKWTVKMGPEARPETAAAHLLWAVGYFTDENYFLKHSDISGLPPHLKRGEKFVTAGDLHDVRLKRHGKKTGEWRWRQNPFSNTR